MQTYLARFNELYSIVRLSEQSLKRVLMAAVTTDMYRKIWRTYSKIPGINADLLSAVKEAGIEEEKLARALSAKKQIARPHKETEKEAAPKGKQEQMAAQAKERNGYPLKPQED